MFPRGPGGGEMGSPRGQEWSPYHLHPYCQPRGSLRPVLSIWFCSRKEATGNQLTCLDPPPQATLALHSAPREGEEASGIRRPGRGPRGGRGIPGTSLKRPGHVPHLHGFFLLEKTLPCTLEILVAGSLCPSPPRTVTRWVMRTHSSAFLKSNSFDL